MVLSVPSRAAGRLSQGQVVWVRYAAYPYQRYGFAEGRVATIGQVRDPRADQFRAQVVVDRLPPTFGRIAQGMQVEADVVLDAKPLWRWLLQPVLAAWARL